MKNIIFKAINEKVYFYFSLGYFYYSTGYFLYKKTYEISLNNELKNRIMVPVYAAL